MSQSFLRDLNYKIQLEQMTLNQWGENKPRDANARFELPTTQSNLKSKKGELPSISYLLNDNKAANQNKLQARQEQIQLYLEKEKRPVIRDGKEYKYNSIPEPNLT